MVKPKYTLSWRCWGLEFLPEDMIVSPDSMRKWAFEQKLIWDEGQLMTPERIEALSEHFVYEDKLAILTHLYKDPSGNLSYIEHPYLPVKTLMKKAKEVRIVY